MNQLKQETPIAIGGIYEYNVFGNTHTMVVDQIEGDKVQGFSLQNSTIKDIYLCLDSADITEQIGFNNTFTPSYQAALEYKETLFNLMVSAHSLYGYAKQTGMIETAHMLKAMIGSLEADLNVVNEQLILIPTKPDTTHMEPISTGLSPLWEADRCVIPSKPPSENRFIGKTIHVSGFSVDCTIQHIFNKHGDEWAKLTHPHFGTLYRKTKSLMLKDLS